MFVCIKKNSDGSHTSQMGGVMQEGWAYWDTNAVPMPDTFPFVNIEVESIHHDAVTAKRGEKHIVLQKEFTRLEVVSATEGEEIVLLESEPETNPSVWDDMAAAIKKGVNDV